MEKSYSPQTTEDDRQAVDLWLKGDQRGFSELYNKYKNRVFGFLIKMTSDRELAGDLLQDTFMAALRNRAQFDRSRSFLSWVFGIAHKRTIDHFRHVKVEHDHQADAEQIAGKPGLSQVERVSAQDMRRMIEEALTTLDPLQREVFLLREQGDVPFKEIAEIMDSPLNTALGRMRLALKNIRTELEKRGVHGVQ